VIGKNTAAALQSGVIYGFAGQVDAIVRRLREELGEEATALATGGLADPIVPGHARPAKLGAMDDGIWVSRHSAGKAREDDVDGATSVCRRS
jgi:hypothetical protein